MSAPLSSDASHFRIQSMAPRMSRMDAVVRESPAASVHSDSTASPPIRSTIPWASFSSRSSSIRSSSVRISWNFTVDEPTFSTSTFIYAPFPVRRPPVGPGPGIRFALVPPRGRWIGPRPAATRLQTRRPALARAICASYHHPAPAPGAPEESPRTVPPCSYAAA